MISSNTKIQPFSFAYNSMKVDKEISGELNSYTTEFRQFDPRLGKWWSTDPMANKRAEWTTYNFCRNNPISNIDPNGDLDDKYNVDKEGNITLVEKNNDDFDVLEGKDDCGDLVSIKVDKGILDQKHSSKGLKPILDIDENTNTTFTKLIEVNFDYFKSKSQDMLNLFTFLAYSTDVEWTLVNTNSISFLGTSHQTSTDGSFSQIKKDEDFSFTDMNYHYHNHPGNNPAPSGWTNADGGDIKQYKKILENNKNVIFKIFTREHGLNEIKDFEPHPIIIKREKK